jgi:3-phosphoshikimate 1-carboxyvinyltransferase
MRLGRLAVETVTDSIEGYHFELGKGVTLADGKDVTIIAVGMNVQMSLKAAELLKEEGISARVIDMHTIKPLDTELAGDISSAAFLMVAATILPGSDFLLEKVGINPTRTGIVDALRAMGAEITFENETEMAGEPVADIRVRAAKNLTGTTIQGDLVVRMIDEFPAFMIAAAYASGETVVRDAAELRTKESDRIAIMATNLQRLGVAIEEYPDGFRISGTGKIPGGATVSAHGDHRIAMSMALAGLRAEAPVAIEHFEMLNESFPDFPRVLAL